MGTKPERRGVYKCPRRHKGGPGVHLKSVMNFIAFKSNIKGGGLKLRGRGVKPVKHKGVWMG